MKKLMAVCCFLFVFSGKSQKYLTYDTINKNEIGVSVTPIVGYLTNSVEGAQLVNYNFSYKHYFTNRQVLRVAFVFFPQPDYFRHYYDGKPQYDRTINGLNVFKVQRTGGGIKSQLNLGFEKIYKVNRLIHGFGAEIFFNHQYINKEENYYSRPFTTNASNYYLQKDSIKYVIDSLGYYSHSSIIGIGLAAFYTVRYQISEHLYVSTSIGPSINFSYGRASTYDRGKKEHYNSQFIDVNFPNAPFISDVSICYRF